MKTVRRLGWTVAAGAGAAAIGYSSYAIASWLQYGKVQRLSSLHPYISAPDVSERHRRAIRASVSDTWVAAMSLDLTQSPVAQAIFKTRAFFMGASKSNDVSAPLIDQATSLGWGILRHTPDQEIAFGAVCQPWDADVVFRAIPADQMRDFREPGYVKIAWNIRVDAEGEGSMLTTETIAAATDPQSRRRFRRYWALASPGIRLIRLEMLRLVRNAAERLH